MSEGDGWVFDAAGWSPNATALSPHSGGFDRWKKDEMPFPATGLGLGQTRMGDVLLNLIPRWSQARRWLVWRRAAVMDVVIIPVMAERCVAPRQPDRHRRQRKRRCLGTLPTWRGARSWFLGAGPFYLAGQGARQICRTIWAKEFKPPQP